MWKQHLFSKRIRDRGGNIDEFHVLTAGATKDDYRFTKRVLARDGRVQKRCVAFMQDCGDRWYVGIDGKVASFLGEDYEYAFEKVMTPNGPRRDVTFVHGYFASRDLPIPDLFELQRRQKEDLKEILSRANSDEEISKADNGAQGILPERITEFTDRRIEDTAWDLYAKVLETKRYPMAGAIFTLEGEIFCQLEITDKEQIKPTQPAHGPEHQSHAKDKNPAKKQGGIRGRVEDMKDSFTNFWNNPRN